MFKKLHQIIKQYHPLGSAILCLLPILSSDPWTNTTSIPLTTQFSESPAPDAPAITTRNHAWLLDDHDGCCQQDEMLVPSFQGIVIDDLSEQFSRQGPERYWHEEDQGFDNHTWWTKNNLAGIDNAARWSLGITQAGTYELFVYIPPIHATTENAIYIISHNGEQDRISVNQKANQNSWHSLGDFYFAGTGDEYIRLIDETGEADTGYEIAFDAVGYLSVDPTWEEKVTGALWERVRPWLDEKTALLEQAFKEWLNEQKGKVLQKLAETLKNWIDQQCAGVGAAMLFPLFALVLWHRQRGKPPGAK
jgi:hypothetical protein